MAGLRKYKIHIAAAFGLLFAALIGFTTAKKVSPVAWGWYGTVNQAEGVALSGWDPVSYHEGAPKVGSAEHEAKFRDATWRFSSVDNQRAFEANPTRYAPAFGAFCAFAVSRGFTANSDPEAFHIVDDVLYVFADAGMRDEWVAALSDNRARGVANWAQR
jgi:hypothetical protein